MKSTNNTCITIGSRYEYAVMFTQEQVNQFASVTGDHNKLHLDAEYAATTPFKRPIVHGFLAGAVFSKVFGTLFPGQGSIYLSQTMDFKRPVYVGEAYLAKFEVIAIDQSKSTATIKSILFNAKNKICIDGKAVVMNKEVIK